jgi:hypothetical protein
VYYSLGYCEAHYHRVHRHGAPQWDKPLQRTARREPFDIERDVIAHLTKDEMGCLAWPYGKGYGTVNDDVKKNAKVHVLVYVYYHGPVPEGLQINHRCGRGDKGCADRRHLYAGTNQQNWADARRHNGWGLR